MAVPSSKAAPVLENEEIVKRRSETQNLKGIKRKDPVWLGGAAAAMAASITHPLDQTKYRMQVQTARTPLLRSLLHYAMRDGVRSLWTGLSASMLRQSVYSTARFALFNDFARRFSSISSSRSQTDQGETGRLTLGATVLAAGLAGGIAGLLGNPTEIVLVRMCADGTKEPSSRFNYSNALVGMVRIAREDGFATFLRGLGPNVARSVLVNVGQIATYTSVKTNLLSSDFGRNMGLKDDIFTHGLASLAAGTVATTVCAPADVLKSRFQNAKVTERGSLMGYVLRTARIEGWGFLMKGWTPAWLRLAPNTVLTFVFLEKLRVMIG